MPEYDEQRFLELCEALSEIIWEMMEMDGNTREVIQEQVDMAYESFGDEDIAAVMGAL